MRSHHQCQRCAACCRWAGEVKVSRKEIARMAAFLGVTEDAFIQQHTRLRFLRWGLALTEKSNGECVFLDGRDCRVQPVKPQQCRDFPEKWNVPGWQGQCQAIRRNV